jgi:hypothetical protein
MSDPKLLYDVGRDGDAKTAQAIAIQAPAAGGGPTEAGPGLYDACLVCIGQSSLEEGQNYREEL